MGYATIIVIVLNVAAMASVAYGGWYMLRIIRGSVADAVAAEIRLQDDRIRKRLERTDDDDRTGDGQAQDGYEIVPGRPVRR